MVILSGGFAGIKLVRTFSSQKFQELNAVPPTNLKGLKTSNFISLFKDSSSNGVTVS
jgi:hypothetical protein